MGLRSMLLIVLLKIGLVNKTDLDLDIRSSVSMGLRKTMLTMEEDFQMDTIGCQKIVLLGT